MKWLVAALLIWAAWHYLKPAGKRRMTADEALQAATLGGARALRREDVGRLGPGARADAVVLDAPSHAHLVYRPGVPLVAHTVARGVVV